MITFVRKTGMFVVRSALAFCALIFIALIAIQIILVTGINLIATGKGSDFFEHHINQAITDTGYHVSFDALYYDPVRGFSVYDLSVSDKNGTFLTLDQFSIGAYLALPSFNTIDLHARGGSLSIERIPESSTQTKSDQKELTPFQVPNLYFRTITISNFSFETIKIGSQVAGQDYILSPSLQARGIITDDIDLSLKIKPGLPALADNLPAPDIIEADATFSPESLGVSLNNLSIIASDYSMNAKGTGSLDQEGTINIVIDGDHHNLSALTGNSFEKAQANLSIIGPLSGPALNLSALVVPLNLKERGLSDIQLILKTEDITQGMNGHAHIESTFNNDPVTVESLLSYEAPILSINDLKLAAPEVSITGGGNLSSDTMIFDGGLDINASDLSHYASLADIELSGKMLADLDFKPSDTGEQSADIQIKVENGAYDAFSVQSLSTTASIASLSNPWPTSATANLRSLRLAPDVSIDTLSANIIQEKSETYKVSLKGQGKVPSTISFDGSAHFSSLTNPIPNIDDIDFALKTGRSSVKIGGLFYPEKIDLTLSTKDFIASDLPASIPEQMKDVRIDLNAKMTGIPSSPHSDITAIVKGIGSGAYQNASLSSHLTHDGKDVSARLNGSGTGIRKMNGIVSFPLSFSLMPFSFSLDQNAPLNGKIDADIDLTAIANLFLPPTQALSGNLRATGDIAGTISAPAPSANIQVTDATFKDDAQGIVIDKIMASATATEKAVTINSLTATDGKEGTIKGNGVVSLQGNNTDATLDIQNFNVVYGDIVNGYVGADLSLSGSLADRMSLSGDLDIAEMHILIPEKFSSTIPQLNIVEEDKESAPSFLDKLALDIKIDAQNQFFVRGWGLDAEFGGNIDISGTASTPQMNGTLESRRGRFEEFGKRFTLAKANLRFQGDVPPSPYLDIEATIPAGDVTGSILLTGPVTTPSINFASTPALPEDEVLSRILFGKDSARISPFQAVQLAQTIRRFSGEGSAGPGLDPLGMIRDATGLDDISVDVDDTGAANVGVGKYLTDNVYLEVESGKAENSGEATITIEVTPSINVESQIGQDAQGGGGIFWKHDY